MKDDSTDAAPSFSEIRESLDKKLFKEKEQPPSPPPPPLPEVVSEGVTISSGGPVIQEDTCNLIVVSGSQGDRAKANTSTITIISDLPDPSNSLASNISQVSVGLSLQFTFFGRIFENGAICDSSFDSCTC